MASLIDELTEDRVSITLLNVNQLEPRQIVVQAGAYAEHQFTAVTIGDQALSIDQPHFTVKLAPGAGTRLNISMKRYVNKPTMAFPWNQNH